MSKRKTKGFTATTLYRTCRPGGKTSVLIGLLLLGGLINTSARAAACYATDAKRDFNFLMNYTLTDPTENSTGRVINPAYEWNLGFHYNVTCSCDGKYTGAYVTTRVPDTGQVYSDGRLNYFKINDYLAVATEVFIGGNYGVYEATPFTSVSNLNSEVSCRKYPYETGSKGRVSLYFRRPFVGVQTIPVTKVVDVFIASDANTQSPDPVSTVWMSGTVTVPQSCAINGGGVINITFDDILSGNFITKGQMPKNFTPKNVNLNVACTNISEGVKVSLSFHGTPDASDSTAFLTTNSDVGVRIQDTAGKTLVPQGGELPLSMDYTTQSAASAINVFPVNTTGKPPETGEFTATATIRAEIQ